MYPNIRRYRQHAELCCPNPDCEMYGYEQDVPCYTERDTGAVILMSEECDLCGSAFVDPEEILPLEEEFEEEDAA